MTGTACAPQTDLNQLSSAALCAVRKQRDAHGRCAHAARGIALVERLTAFLILVACPVSGLWAASACRLLYSSYVDRQQRSLPYSEPLGRPCDDLSRTYFIQIGALSLLGRRHVAWCWGPLAPAGFGATNFPPAAIPCGLPFYPAPLAEAAIYGLAHGRLPSRSGHLARSEEHPRGDPVSDAWDGGARFPRRATWRSLG